MSSLSETIDKLRETDVSLKSFSRELKDVCVSRETKQILRSYTKQVFESCQNLLNEIESL